MVLTTRILMIFFVAAMVWGCGRDVRRGNTTQIQLPPENNVPFAVGAAFQIEEDETLSESLVAIDIDADPLMFSVERSPQHGELSLEPSGKFSYRPQSGFSGTDAFSFTVHDGKERSAAATVSLFVSAGASQTVSAPRGVLHVVPEHGDIFLLGERARVSWDVEHAQNCLLNGVAVEVSGELLSAPLAGTFYLILECSGPGGTKTLLGVASPVSSPEPLAVPSQLRVARVSHREVVLRWDHDGANTIAYRLERSAAQPIQYQQIAVIGATEREYTNIGISPGGRYRYRIRAANADRNSLYSAAIAVNIPDAPVDSHDGGTGSSDSSASSSAPPEIVTFHSVAVTSSSLRLSWQSGGGNTEAFLVAHRSGTGAPADCSGGKLVQSPEITLSGLSPYTVYGYRVCAVSANGKRSQGLVGSKRTLDRAPREVHNPKKIAATMTSITIGWDFIGDDRNVAGGFLLKGAIGSTPPADCKGSGVVEKALSARSHTFTNLTPGTAYSVRVCTKNGNGQISDGYSRAVVYTAPANPTWTVTYRQRTALDVNWREGSANTSHYLLKVVKGATPPSNCEGGIPVMANRLVLASLIPDTQYAARLCAVGPGGERSDGLVGIDRTLP